MTTNQLLYDDKPRKNLDGYEAVYCYSYMEGPVQIFSAIQLHIRINLHCMSAKQLINESNIIGWLKKIERGKGTYFFGIVAFIVRIFVVGICL